VTAEDWIFGVFLAPLLISGVWYVCFQVWRAGMDTSDAVGWFTGQGSSGYHAFLGPGAVSMTTGWLGAMATIIQGSMDSPPAWMDPVIDASFAICLLSMLVGFWLWRFSWPRFMVPPQFRGQR